MLAHAMQTSEASVEVFIFPLEATAVRLNNVGASCGLHTDRKVCCCLYSVTENKKRVWERHG